MCASANPVGPIQLELDRVVADRFPREVARRAGIELHSPNVSGLDPSIVQFAIDEIRSDRWDYNAHGATKINIAAEQAHIEKLDREHWRPEHGAMRHRIDAAIAEQIGFGGSLLDYGAGGGLHKSYYAGRRSVTVVDMNLSALLRLRALHPTTRLVWTPTWLTDIPSGTIDCAMASGVVCYASPNTNRMMLDEMARVVRRWGRIVLGLVPAWGFSDWIVGRGHGPYQESHSGVQRSTVKDIEAALAKCGFAPATTRSFLVAMPRPLRRAADIIFRHPIACAIDETIHRVVPGLATWHVITATKL